MDRYDAIGGGAGGNWETIDEVPDSRVVRQSDPLSCGAACGEMLLRDRGVAVSQGIIAARAGTPSGADEPAQALNEHDLGGTWFGSGVTEESFDGLNATGSWAAMFFESGARFGHWVVVEGVNNEGLVIVLDSADGTRYLMELDEFLSHWTLFSVFRR